MKKYNKYLFRIMTLFIFTVLIFCSVKINVNASEKVILDKRNSPFFSEEEIGKSEEQSVIYENRENDNGITTFSNILPNSMTFDWVATENWIIIYITNTGLDSVDLVSGTIKTGNITKNFAFSKVSIGTSTYSVTVPIKSCHEDIRIYFYAVDGGDTFGRTTSYGSRDIPNDLLNKWAAGSFGSKSKSLNYHLKKHGPKF